MAIAEMEKLELSVDAEHLDGVLELIQRFHGVHIETGFESTIPQERRVIVDREIRAIEKNLQELQTAISILRGRESAKGIGLLNSSEEKRLSISELTSIVEESGWLKIIEDIIHTDRRLQNNITRRQEIIELLDTLKIWEHLNCNPIDFNKLHRATAFFGSVHIKHIDDFSDMLARHEEEGVYFEQVTVIDDRAYLLIVLHNSLLSRINVLQNEFSFSEEEYPFDAAQAKTRLALEEEEAALIVEEDEIGLLITEQSVYDELLCFAEDYNLNMLLRKKKSLEIVYDEGNITISGWIVSEKRKLFEKMLSDSVPRENYTLFIRQVDDRDLDMVPIKLKNNKLVTVYERLTEMYSLPRYNELDPTPVMTVFYLIFYGLMVADVGYGLAVFLIGLLVKKVLKLKRSTESFVDFLFYLSFPIMAWGMICGSFFGLDLPFGLFSVRRQIIEMIFLSLAMGYLQIMTGLVLHMINRAKLNQRSDMLSEGLSWFLAFLGGGVMIVTGLIPMLRNDVVFIIGLVVTLIGGGMIIVVPAITYGKRWYAGIGKGLYALYGATSYLGDFVSYTRLMALGVAGASVANAFNTILAFLPLILRVTLGIILAVALHGLNMFLSMLSAYVHGIRLQFIEFFNKFYTGGGRRFEPFKAAEKNVIITDIVHDQ